MMQEMQISRLNKYKAESPHQSDIIEYTALKMPFM